MRQFTRIILHDMSPFHIGKGRDFYDLSEQAVSSDSLSAALAALRAQTGKTEDIEDFLNSFELSSAFPYSHEHYFLPRLSGRINVYIPQQDEATYRKQLKHIKYIETNLWRQLTSSPKPVAINKAQICGSYLLGSVDLDFNPPIATAVTQRVKVPREDGLDAEPFYFQWNYVNPDAGLYCLLRCDAPLKDEIIQLFEALGEAGFGSDKNIGGGHFKVEAKDIEVEMPQDGNAQVVLSTYIPTNDEIQSLNLLKSRYDLKKIGGFMAGSNEEEFRHLHRKSIYAFNTGSVFATTATLAGRIVDLSPDWNSGKMHPVWRSGKAITLILSYNYE